MTRDIRPGSARAQPGATHGRRRGAPAARGSAGAGFNFLTCYSY